MTDAALATDGIVGPASIRALEAFLKRRGAEGERRLLALLNAFQGARYADLAEGRSANRAFIYGWLGRITERRHDRPLMLYRRQGRAPAPLVWDRRLHWVPSRVGSGRSNGHTHGP
ncbi:putative peptidoglycan-binding domain-containing protein [Sphingomonas sp. MMS24-JH45]